MVEMVMMIIVIKESGKREGEVRWDEWKGISNVMTAIITRDAVEAWSTVSLLSSVHSIPFLLLWYQHSMRQQHQRWLCALYTESNSTLGYWLDSFLIFSKGPPQPLRSCSISNHSLTSLLVDCVSGDDGGLKQQFHIEVYHSSNHPNDSPSSSSAGHHGSSSLSKSSSSVRMSSSSLTPTLVFNGSSSERATFVIENLTPGSEYNLVIYASNERGKSNPLYLNALTLGPPEKRTSEWSVWLLNVLLGCLSWLSHHDFSFP